MLCLPMQAFARMMRIFRQKDSTTAQNCHQMAPHNLVLSGDVAYGVQKQFESEGRTALRLSYFLSNYLQVSSSDADNNNNNNNSNNIHTRNIGLNIVTVLPEKHIGLSHALSLHTLHLVPIKSFSSR